MLIKIKKLAYGKKQKKSNFALTDIKYCCEELETKVAIFLNGMTTSVIVNGKCPFCGTSVRVEIR